MMKTKRSMVMAILVTMLTIAMVTTRVEAAKYPGPDGMSVSVIQGLTTLVLPDGSHKQLTYNDLAKDAGIDGNGVCYVIYKSHDGEQGGLLSFYAYKYQSTSTLVELDANVVQFETDNSGYVTGWIRADGSKGYALTDEQVRQKTGYTGGTANNGNTNSGATSNNGNNTTNGNTNNGSSTTTNSCTNNASNSTTTKVPQNTVPTSGTGTSTTTNTTTTIGEAVFTSATVTYPGANGKTYTLDKSDMIVAVYTDKSTGTVYILYRTGELKIWCYYLQKDEQSIRLTTISSKATGFASTGFYEVGNANVVPFKTMQEVSALVTPATTTQAQQTTPATTTQVTTTTQTQQQQTTSTVNTAPSKAYKYAAKVQSRRYKKYWVIRLIDSNKKLQNRIRLYYKGKDKGVFRLTQVVDGKKQEYTIAGLKGVAAAGYYKNGDVWAIKNSGKVYKINIATGKATKMDGNAKRFRYKGYFVNKIEFKNGKKRSIASYY